MMLGLRAASFASHMGKLRICTVTTPAPISKEDAMTCWMQDLRGSPQKDNPVAQNS
jgi:hypothetical protein